MLSWHVNYRPLRAFQFSSYLVYVLTDKFRLLELARFFFGLKKSKQERWDRLFLKVLYFIECVCETFSYFIFPIVHTWCVLHL